MKNDEKIIENVVNDSDLCFISAIDEDGFPNTQEVLNVRKKDGIKKIYIMGNATSSVVKAFKNNSKACLYFSDRSFVRGIMLKGTVKILEDQESKDMLWQYGDETYYPKGKNDPNYCVIEFTSILARYCKGYESADIEL